MMMNKTFTLITLMLLSLFGSVSVANAADDYTMNMKLSAEKTSFTPGNDYLINVDVTNTILVKACQADVVLPKGLKFLPSEDGETKIFNYTRRIPRGQSLADNQLTDSTARFIIVPVALDRKNIYIEPGEGAVCTFKVHCTDSLAAKSVIKLVNVAFSDTLNGDEGMGPDHTALDVTLLLSIDENADNDFTAYSGKTIDVKLTRTFKAGNWNTLVLPFDLTNDEVEAAFGSSAQVANFTNNEANTIELNTVDSKAIAANTPVLVKTTADVANPTFSGRTIVAPAAGGPVLTGANGINFVGSYAKSIILTTDDYFISGTNLWRSEGKTTLAATRAYFKVTATSTASGAKGIKLFIDGVENTTTAINSVETAAAHAGVIYNLNGQKVADSATTRLPAGVYIVKGKKVIIK